MLLRLCKLENPAGCRKCNHENGRFYCGLTPSEKMRREKGVVIGGHLMRETYDSLNQIHNPWCPHYFTECVSQKNNEESQAQHTTAKV